MPRRAPASHHAPRVPQQRPAAASTPAEEQQHWQDRQRRRQRGGGGVKVPRPRGTPRGAHRRGRQAQADAAEVGRGGATKDRGASGDCMLQHSTAREAAQAQQQRRDGAAAGSRALAAAFDRPRRGERATGGSYSAGPRAQDAAMGRPPSSRARAAGAGRGGRQEGTRTRGDTHGHAPAHARAWPARPTAARKRAEASDGRGEGQTQSARRGQAAATDSATGRAEGTRRQRGAPLCCPGETRVVAPPPGPAAPRQPPSHHHCCLCSPWGTGTRPPRLIREELEALAAAAAALETPSAAP